MVAKHYYPPTILKLHSVIKCLSKCHVVVGLLLLILSTLADYVSYRLNTVRMHGLAESCSFYFILTGVTGIFGAASHRRGLIIAFMLMTVHSWAIFAPIIIIASSFDIHFYRRECWGECDWHLLSASIPTNSRCQILCGEQIDNNLKSSMTRLGTDYRIDAGLISLAILEFFMSIFTSALCFKQIFGTGDEVVLKRGSANSEVNNTEMRPLHPSDTATTTGSDDKVDP